MSNLERDALSLMDIMLDHRLSMGPRDTNRYSNASISETNAQQVPSVEPRPLTAIEEGIIKTINTCLRNWYKPWKKTYSDDGREFSIVYDLMDGLLHYEYQITSNQSVLSNDRANAIAQAVARLVDYGNAILNLDIIIRNKDETSSEKEPYDATTIELYQAHVKANNLREKLLYDYFKKDKPPKSATTSMGDEPIHQSPSSLSLQVPGSTNGPSMQSSPTLERSFKSLIGSNTSINSATDGRRTPQPNVSPNHIEVRVNQSNSSKDSNQLEITHMTATLRSHAFAARENSSTRMTLLPGVLARIKSLLSDVDEIASCFDLLDTLLNAIEKLPPESRNEEVIMTANILLDPLCTKFHDRTHRTHWMTCLLSLIQMMNYQHFDFYRQHINNQAQFKDFLKAYLFIVEQIAARKAATPKGSEPSDFKNPKLVFPDCWIDMKLAAFSILLNSLTHIYRILRDYFPTNAELWRSFIDCLVSFILQNALKPGRFMLKERQQRLAHDLRQGSASYILATWNYLYPDLRRQQWPNLLEPILRASITLDSNQRSILLSIFYDMMIYDYNNQYKSPSESTCDSNSSTFYYDEDELAALGSFNPVETSSPAFNESLPYLSCRVEPNEETGEVLKTFTHSMIGILNTLMIELDLGDECFKSELCSAIRGEMKPSNQDSYSSFYTLSNPGRFRSVASYNANLVAEFIQISLDLRQAEKLFYEHLSLLCMFRLVQFFQYKVDRIELHLDYLYRLCSANFKASQFIEAGYTLLAHAKTLEWSSRLLDEPYRIIKRYFQEAKQLTDCTSLKIFLYNTIIDYFDQGQLWEACVPLCKELLQIYEFTTYEYDKVGEILQKMSTYFKSIIDSNGSARSHPEYFRVTFYGMGFPESLRDGTMVYRGRAYEKLGDFEANLLDKYPDATALRTLAKPDESLINEPNAKYLQITACSPVVDLETKFGVELSNIQESILNYYRHNECNKFEFSRRISRPPISLLSAAAGSSADQVHSTSGGSSDDFGSMWREKTTLTTNTLPGMLPFFPVYADLTKTDQVSPIGCAIEDLERTNDRLKCMVNRFRADKHRQTEDIRLLGQLLTGIINAAVNGGITKYEDAFLNNNTTANNNSTNGISNDNGNVSDEGSTITNSTYGGGRRRLSSNASTMNSRASIYNSYNNNNGQNANIMVSNSPDDAYVTITPAMLVGGGGKQTSGVSSMAAATAKSNHNMAAGCLIDHHQRNNNNLVNRANGCGGYDAMSWLPSGAQLEKLKTLIAAQMPLLDEGIELHRDRVADVLRPQHEHLEATYKELKYHVLTKYRSYLSSSYRRSIKGFKARYESMRVRGSPSGDPMAAGSGKCATTSRLPPPKRMSDAGPKLVDSPQSDGPTSGTNFPYKQLSSSDTRRSLPFLLGAMDLSSEMMASGSSTKEAAAKSQQSALQPALMLANEPEPSGYSKPPLPIPAARQHNRQTRDDSIRHSSQSNDYVQCPIFSSGQSNSSDGHQYKRLIGLEGRRAVGLSLTADIEDDDAISLVPSDEFKEQDKDKNQSRKQNQNSDDVKLVNF